MNEDTKVCLRAERDRCHGGEVVGLGACAAPQGQLIHTPTLDLLLPYNNYIYIYMMCVLCRKVGKP